MCSSVLTIISIKQYLLFRITLRSVRNDHNQETYEIIPKYQTMDYERIEKDN